MRKPFRLVPQTTRRPRRRHRLARLAAVFAGAAFLAACPPAPKPDSKPVGAAATSAPATPAYALGSARRQASYLKITLPQRDAKAAIAKIEIATATGPERWPPARITMVAGAPRTGTVTGPIVDQLTGTPTTRVDVGTVLPAVPFADGVDLRTFTLPASSASLDLFARVDVPPLLQPGDYVFPVTFIGADDSRETATLTVSVADITLPTDTRTHALATATMEEMAAAYPESFGKLPTLYVERADPESAPAALQLDAVVKTAQRNGVTFFVEDLAPVVKIDEVGRVVVEWDAYDKIVAPYLDGTAFQDRTPLPLWLAPAPPRRIRETPAQLRQYLAACAEHYKDRGWTQTPAFLHAALIDESADPALRKQVMEIVERNLDRSFVLVGTPDLTSTFRGMWVVPEDDTRLPPANRLASASTVRAWPWMCAARGLRGLVWRHAIQPASAKDTRALPLFAVGEVKAEAVEPDVTLRLAWLTAGLNDTAHFALVQKRTDPAVANELLAGVVGRTGLAAREGPHAAGYLYAGWPGDESVWPKLPAMLDSLILANDPGKNVPADDPQVLQAKIFLAQSHRPVARVAGYSFAVSRGEGTIIDATTDFLIENPLGVLTPMSLSWPLPPGDFAVEGKSRRGSDTVSVDIALPAYGLLRSPLKLSGHLDSLREAPKLSPMQLLEHTNGTRLELAALIPVYRMRATKDGPKIDGLSTDWPDDAYQKAYGPMNVELAYQNRAALLSGKVRRVDAPAAVRWSFDADYVYAMVNCPQPTVADERTGEWPVQFARWWGTDGIQIQLAGGGGGGVKLGEGTRVVHVAVKPSGIVLMRTAKMQSDGTAKWSDTPLPGLKHAVSNTKDGYAVELAFPRTWFPAVHDADNRTPCWRVNVLRHTAAKLESASWSGPVTGDADLPMMGLLVGAE